MVLEYPFRRCSTGLIVTMPDSRQQNDRAMAEIVSEANRLKVRAGLDFSGVITDLLDQLLEVGLIKSVQEDVHFSHGPLAYPQQYLVNYLVETYDSKIIVVRSSTSFRNDRAKIGFYDLQGILLHGSMGKSIIASIYLVPDKELENKTFIGVRKKVENGEYYCPATHLLCLTEFVDFLTEYKYSQEIEDLIDPAASAIAHYNQLSNTVEQGSYLGLQGNQLERDVVDILLDNTNLVSLKHSQKSCDPMFYLILNVICDVEGIEFSDIVTLNASNKIVLLRGGGMRMAFERNGCKCVFSSEWDVHAQATYKANFDDEPFGDITALDEKAVPDHDILVGGFPCQPFSSVGKREGFKHATQGTLFFDVVRILKEKEPSAVLLENVVGLVNHDGGNTFRQIKETLESELGYQVDTRVLDSADFGVPQHRRRIYIVGLKAEKGNDLKFEWPEPNIAKVGIGQFIESSETGYTISEHLQNSYMYKVNDGRPQLVDRESEIQVKTLVASYHKIQRLTGTFVKDGETGMRLLTHNECKAIMGFPKDFQFPVSRTQMYRQMGNSVAVPVVQAIAKNMVESLQKAERAKYNIGLRKVS